MKRRTLWLCRVIVQLNRIPRYGRLCPMTKEPPHFGPAQWKFQRNGLWGFNILSRLNLFWPYVDECMTGAPWVTPEEEHAQRRDATFRRIIDDDRELLDRLAAPPDLLDPQEGDDDETTNGRPTEHDGLA